MAIIKTLADTDLYKKTMGHVVNQHFGDAEVTYALKVRSKVDWSESDVNNIRNEIAKLVDITYDEAEMHHLEKACKYLPKHYRTFLKGFRLNTENIKVTIENGELQVTTRGLWSEEIYLETILMAIISECYFENRSPLSGSQIEETYEKAKNKGKKLRELRSIFYRHGYKKKKKLCSTRCRYTRPS